MIPSSLKTLAIIPARAGSKRLPLKNVKPLLGKPLVAWTAQQASRCQYFNKLIISTDCDNIASIAKSEGAEVPFMRPEILAQDNSSSFDLVEHTLNHFASQGEAFDIIVLLEPTSPLRARYDLDNAMKLFLENYNEFDALISVGAIDREHPSVIKSINADKTIKAFVNCDKDQQAYFPYGVIYAVKVKKLLETKNFYQERSLPYIIERWQNFEIDDDVDFYCVERLMEVFHKNL